MTRKLRLKPKIKPATELPTKPERILTFNFRNEVDATVWLNRVYDTGKFKAVSPSISLDLGEEEKPKFIEEIIAKYLREE